MGCAKSKPEAYAGPTVPDEPVLALVTADDAPAPGSAAVLVGGSGSGNGGSAVAAKSPAVSGVQPVAQTGSNRSVASSAKPSPSTPPSSGTSSTPPSPSNNNNNSPSTPPKKDNANKPARPKDGNRGMAKGTQWDPETLQAKRNFAELYSLGEKIGEGNYSVVHQALDRSTGQQVAVKIVDKRELDESDIREIKGEVSILGEMDHPNIISLYGFFEDDANFYIVTEMMLGGELFDEIVEREFYWERDAQEVIKTLADALAYMHERGIVHRDLKPENILLTSKEKNAVVKLADFGFAVRTDTSRNEFQLTTACGTPGYVAPEIIAGVKYGPEVDNWSLGIITFILLAGYPPFHDDDQNELFRMIRKGKFSFDPAYWSVVSDAAKDVVRGLICVDRGKRLKAKDVLKHAWITNLPEEVTKTLPGGSRSAQGLEGRGGAGSINLSPALRELKKFQARRRWKDNMALALAREGQIFSNATAAGVMLTTIPGAIEPNKPGVKGVDISKLGGLGTSEMLNRLLVEKRARLASGRMGPLTGPEIEVTGVEGQ